MSLLSTFTTNSINILAGINGSEVSQALIIALSIVLNDLLYLPWPVDFRIPLHLLGNQAEVDIGGVWSAGMAHGSKELVGRHLFSLYFMLPLIGVCTGFMYHNWLAYLLFRVFCTNEVDYPLQGTLHVPSLVTPSVMSQEWRFRSLAFRPISRRHFCYFSCHRYSTLCYLALNFSASCLVQDTEYQGITTTRCFICSLT
jgi:hypothetical protein